jgi:hypothetical protein
LKTEPTETPADVPVEPVVSTPKRTHTTPIGKTTIVALAKSGHVFDINGEYCLFVSSVNPEVSETRLVSIIDLIGLNDSIITAINKEIAPEKAGISSATAAIRKALAAGVSMEDLIASL